MQRRGGGECFCLFVHFSILCIKNTLNIALALASEPWKSLERKKNRRELKNRKESLTEILCTVLCNLKYLLPNSPIMNGNNFIAQLLCSPSIYGDNKYKWEIKTIFISSICACKQTDMRKIKLCFSCLYP